MAKTPGGMLETIRSNLKAKTGKTVEEWSRVLKKERLGTRKERVEWLMKEHKLGRVAANLVAAHAEGNTTDYGDSAKLIGAMFSGERAALRPVYNAVVEAARALGPDVSVSAGKTQVTLKRRRQFAWIKPATRTRIDLGLALGSREPGGRLLSVSGTNEDDRVRLRIPLDSVAAVDDEVRRWLKAAYDLDA